MRGRRGKATVVRVPRTSGRAHHPEDHPLRAIRKMTDQALSGLSPLFDQIYAQAGRPSIRLNTSYQALLVKCSTPSRRSASCANTWSSASLFRWFVGLDLADPVWHPTTFTRNRERLLAGEVAEAFFFEVKKQAEAGRLLSRALQPGRHPDGGSRLKTSAPKKRQHAKDEARDGPAWWRRGVRLPEGRSRSQSRHRLPRGAPPQRDPCLEENRPGGTACQALPGEAARLAYGGHLSARTATGLRRGESLGGHGTAEREVGAQLVGRERKGKGWLTVAADKNYNTKDFVQELRSMNVTHVARKTGTRPSMGAPPPGRATPWAKKRKLAGGGLRLDGEQDNHGWAQGRARARWVFSSRPPLTIWCECDRFLLNV